MEINYFEPGSIGFLTMILGLMYMVVVGICLSKCKFDNIGYIFMGISIILYLYVGYYTTASAYYKDENGPVMFGGLGYLELIVLSYPYIFLSIACRFSEKRE